MVTEKRSGIYKILNKVNNEFYIGSAVYFARRKAQHFHCLRNNRHGNDHLQKAWNRYGESSFEFIIVEVVLDKNNLIEREQYWLDSSCPYYNIGKIASSSLGIKRSLETRRRVSEAAKRVKHKPHTAEARLKISIGLRGKSKPSHNMRKPKPYTFKKRSKLIIEILNTIIMEKETKKISTTDIPEGKLPKVLQPGNVIIKVNAITIKKEPFEGDPVNIILHCEGEDQGAEFEGFDIDKDHPELGKAKGQVGKVRAQEYTFNNEAFQGKQRDKKRDILKWLQSFCKVIDRIDWIKAQDDKYDTVEEIVEAMNTEKPFADIWLNSCLAGKAYTNQQGFINYDLFLPWFKLPQLTPLEKVGTDPSKLIKFNQDYHIKSKGKKKTEVLEGGFEGKRKAGSDLDL